MWGLDSFYHFHCRVRNLLGICGRCATLPGDSALGLAPPFLGPSAKQTRSVSESYLTIACKAKTGRNKTSRPPESATPLTGILYEALYLLYWSIGYLFACVSNILSHFIQ